MKKNIYFILKVLLPAIVIYMTIPMAANLFAEKKYSSKNIYKMTIIGHRGGSDLAPENTLLCIDKGISAGADMIEIDIHMSKDGELIVCHDRTIDRTTNGKGKICDMTLSEIKKYKIKDSSGNITDETIPTLDEVLNLVNGKSRLLIEIKRTKKLYRGIESKLLGKIRKYNAYDWVVVQSFNDSVLETLYALDKKIRLEKLIILKLQWLPVIFDGTFTRFSYDKYHYISSFNYYHKTVSKKLIDDIHSHGKEIKVWTLKGPEDTTYLPVDGIITDRPDLWKKQGQEGQ